MKDLFRRDDPFIRNAGWNFSAAAVPLVSTVFSIGIFYRNISGETLSQLLLYYAVITAFTVSDFGIGRIACTKILDSNGSGLPTITTNAFVASIFLSLFLLLVAFFFVFCFFGGTPLDSILVSISVGATCVFNGVKGMLDGFEKFRELFKYKVFQSAAIYLVPAALSYFTSEIAMFLSVIALLRLSVAAYIYVCEIDRLTSFSLISQSELGDYVRYGKWAFWSNGVSILLSYADRFIVVKLVGGEQSAGYLSVVDLVSRSSVVTGSVLQAGYKKLVSMNRYVPSSLLLSIAGFFIFCFMGFAMLGDYFIVVWLGEGNAYIKQIFLVLIASTAFNSMAQVCHYSMLAKYNQRRIALVHTVEVVVFLPVAYILVETYGVLGGAIALLVRNLFDFCALRILEVRYN